MKKLFTIIALSGILLFTAKDSNAHIQGFELGVRFGFSQGVDFAMPLGSNRLHANVGFGNSLNINALIDWQFPFFGDGAFILYPGIGVSTEFGDEFKFGAAGEIGLKYQFEFP